MNSRIAYMYRDASNYKTFEEVIIKGVLKEEDLRPYFEGTEYFIPSEVGLEDLQPDPLTVQDHIWHELESITPTDEPATVDIGAKAFIKMVQKAHSREWNQMEVFQRKGIL